MPDNHIHPVPETAEAAVPSDISTSPIQSGLDVQVMPLKANLQAADPDIERTGDLQTASSDLEISGDLQATGPVLNNLQVAASVHQGSDAGGLQISASDRRLRPFPNTGTLWTDYLLALPNDLPHMNLILAGYKTPFHSSATYSDYLVRIIAGDHRGGPVTGAGMEPLALDGLMRLTDEEILKRIVHLDLTVRLFRRSYVSLKATCEREAAAQAKIVEMEAQKEMFERSQAMFDHEFEGLEDDRARFRYDLELFAGAKSKFDHDLLRFGEALNLGMTIEEIQMNHDRLIERLGTVLESSLMDATAQLQILANIGVSGGMQQWFQRSQDLLERKAKLTNSVQQAQSVSQARGVEQAQIVVQAQVVEQENRHRVAIQKLEQENERLRKQVGDRINDLQVAEIKQDDERRTWLGGVCAMQ